MNTFFVLQAAAGQQAGSNWSFLLMMVAIFGVMYFFMIRPQKKKQKEIEKFRNSLKKGDKVVTIGGIYGTVAEIKEKYVLVEVDANVKLRIDKSAIVKDMSDVPAK
ncbi:MAG: preprotein translocase subunit YajC [Bacteroidales bacterium]|nr:preprotein translocase subunit YajC [Bacteroidales bacterium]